jgi:RsiW-degrading membrane proteinase PrsW (M82 family)
MSLDILLNTVVENSIFFAPFFGIIPALIWLWFWLKEDIHHEPNKFIIFSFLCGMLAVLISLPLQKIFLGIPTFLNDYRTAGRAA